MYKFIFREKRLVALDVKTLNDVARLLTLYAGTEFLIIQLHSFDSYPLLLGDLFSQATVCFVGVRMSDILSYSINIKGKIIKISAECNTGVELGYLAARVLKNPDLIQEHGLKKLAQAVGVTLKQSTFSATKTPAWSARVFSAEQIKLAIHDAYMAYLIGSKLLEKIEVLNCVIENGICVLFLNLES
ncbi:hypothetical protein SLEP1_g13961 [Rubroshorea leprosula]|uniref:3'-5' exonuclease domain-containing protein n=1 Tax=Rubroshorea leprosula TaxID=152421 RepID=A0AAV5IRL5_9ROSI|nr:hypothetical protein SLEP1_g13961 [Rubroshorea leprosula]